MVIFWSAVSLLNDKRGHGRWRRPSFAQRDTTAEALYLKYNQMFVPFCGFLPHDHPGPKLQG